MNNFLIIILVLAAIIFLYYSGFFYTLEIFGDFNNTTSEDYVKKLPIYVINLKDRPDRKQKIEKEMLKHNLKNVTILEAVNGYDLDIDELLDNDLYTINEDIARPLKRGEIGCYLSHLEAWYKILRDKEPYALIIEDDAVFVENFKEKLNDALNKIKNSNWDVLFLGRNCSHFEYECNRGTPVNNEKILMYPLISGYGTFAYIIKNRCIRKLLKDTFPLIKPVDVVLLEKDDIGDIKIIVFVNNIASVRNSHDSDTIAIK